MTLETAATTSPAGSGNESGATAAGQAQGATAPAAPQGTTTATTTTVAAPPPVPGLEDLDKEYPGLSPEQKASITKILTPKFQKAADALKAAQAREAQLGDLARLVDMSRNGKAKEVLQTLAAASGIKINFGDETAAAEMDPVSAEMHAVLAETLGEEAASKLVPILRKSAEQTVAPLQQQAAISAAQAQIERYFASKPEAAKYKDKIEELSRTIHPAPGAKMTVEQWMDTLHTIASAGDAEAKGAAAALAQIHGSAAAAGGGATNGGGARDTDVTTASGSDEGKSFTQILKETAAALVNRK